MRSHEIEALEAGRAHATRRQDAHAASPELAARAAAAGRTDALGPTAVLRLQRDAGNAGVVAALEGDQEAESPVSSVIGKGGGAPLDAPVRQRMEASFGADFSDVRVHEGGAAAASARAVDAHAYTVGNEVVLGAGQTTGSDRTLAHELAHVVQQRQGPVEGTPAAGGISISHPSDRFERAAEATADAVVATGRASDPGAPAAAPSAQREAAPDEPEEIQELAIQRQVEPGDEEEDKSAQALAIQRATEGNKIEDEDEILL